MAPRMRNKWWAGRAERIVPELYTSVFFEMLETQFSNNRNAQKAIFEFSKMLKKQFSNFRLGMYDMRFRLGI